MKFSPDDSINEVEFAFFDLETTGLNPNTENIIEVGIVKASADKELDTLQTFVSIGKSIPEGASNVNGITDDMLVGAPKIKEVLAQAGVLLEGCVLVAHNITFDFGFLNAELTRNDMPIFKDCLMVDTVKLARMAFPNLSSYKLEALATHFGISVGQHHRALDDAQACRELMFRCTDVMSIMGELALSEILF